MTRVNPLVETLVADRHSLPLSVALHLVPGALVVLVYLVATEPLVKAVHYPTFLGWALALVVVLYPLLGGLFWLGRCTQGRISLRGVVRNTQRWLSPGKTLGVIVVLVVWMTTVSLALNPLDQFLFDHVFWWVPFEGAGGSATTYLDGYSHEVLVTTMLICLFLTGLTLPWIEELYFRGFLLPRLAHLGVWAPVLNTVLFSVYHFWAPWTVVSKLIFLAPGIWLVWSKKDLRLSIGMHAGTTFLMALAGTVAISLGFGVTK